jgi:hypothetical protein
LLKPRDCPEFSNRAGKASAFTLSASGSKIHGKAIEMPETPESRCDFSSQGADLEWVMRLECPEFGRGGGRRESGVKAVEDDRTPSPGGHAERRGTDERSWKLRRGVSEEGGRGAWPKDRFFQRLWQVGKSKMRDATESCVAGWLRGPSTEKGASRSRPYSSRPTRACSSTERELFSAASGLIARTNAKNDIHKWLVFSAYFEVPWEGSGDFLGEVTWASARATRSSPGFNMTGFQPCRVRTTLHVRYGRSPVGHAMHQGQILIQTSPCSNNRNCAQDASVVE